MMKNFVKVGLKKMFVASLALAMIVSVASCKQDDDDDDGGSSSNSSGSSVVLPSSVGDNVLKGKTWEQSEEGYSKSYAFSNNTVTESESWTEEGESGSSSTVYNYTYDATKSVLYMSLKSVSNTYGDKTYSWSSTSEFKKLAEKEGESGTELDYDVARMTSEFNTALTFKYTVSDTTLKLVDYFTGSLPTAVNFSEHLDTDTYVEAYNGGFEFEGTASDKYYIYPTFADGPFTGTMYKRVRKESKKYVYTSLGTASGTYTTSGTGTKDCTITITFTSLPEGASAITANTAYTLKHDYESSETYSLKQ